MIKTDLEVTEIQSDICRLYRELCDGLPVHYYPYIVKNYPKEYLTPFFNFFSFWWGHHGRAMPRDISEEDYFNVVDKKWEDFKIAFDVCQLEKEWQVVNDGDMLEKVVNEFWDGFKNTK